MAQARAAKTFAERQAQVATSDRHQQVQSTRLSNFQTAVQQAVGSWESTIRKSDPDFDRKKQSLQDAAYAVIAQRGFPQSPEQAVEWAKEAYARVNKTLREFAPRPVATKPTPGNGSSGNRSGLSPAPASLEEAIRGAMRLPAS
jgi:hypothetical protein